MRIRLVLLLIAAFSALGVWRAFHLIDDRDERVRSAREHLLIKAKMIALRQDALAERTDAILNGLIANPAIDPVAPPSACRQQLLQILAAEPDIEQFGVARADGSLACSAITRPGSINFADRAWFQTTLASTGMVVGDIVTSRTTGNPTIPMAKSRRDSSGEVVAVYYGGVDLDWMGRNLAATGQLPSERVAVVDGQGVLVARYPDPEHWIGTKLQIADVLTRIQAEQPGTIEQANRLGEPRLIAHVPLLRSTSGVKYQLLVSIPRSDVEAPAKLEVVRAAGGLFLALVLTAGFLLLVLDRWVVLPILDLSKIAERLKAGDLAARSGPPYARSEIGAFAASLDSTAASLQEREIRLAHANRALSVLSAGNQTLLRCHDEDELLKQMCRATAMGGSFQLAWIGYLDSGWIEAKNAFGRLDDARTVLARRWGMSPDDTHPARHAIEHRSPQIWTDALSNADPTWSATHSRLGCRATLTLPLELDGEMMGVFTFGSEDLDAFDPASVDVLLECSRDLALGIRLARDELDRRRMVVELRTRGSDLESLVAARTSELIEARDAAEVATRSKSAFLANMSHEIRTPMNAIIGLNHLVMMDTPDARQRDRLQKVDSAAHHLLQVINDILDLSKIEAGKTELRNADFARDDLFERSISMVSEAARAKGLSLVIGVAALPGRLHGDAQLLAQAIINLLANAVKFTEVGTISLRAEVVDNDGARLLVRFSVTDTGIGIAPESQGALFNAFEQADTSTTRTFGGTGLGLALTRRIAVLMGGSAGLESQIGHGSTFWFTAWLDRFAARQADESSSAESSFSAVEGVDMRLQAIGELEESLIRGHAGQRVLLAEDNAVNREVAGELLQRAGLIVDLAINGEEAIDMARRIAYALILMDVQMPVLDGLDATRAIREALPDLPIIAMTAGAMAEERQACVEAGMTDFLVKPVDPRRLYVTLLRWLPQKSQ